jgi:hypothetical protein
VSVNSYQFLTLWRIEGMCGEVADVLGDPLAFPRWWPAVYLDVEEIRPAGEHRVGQRIRQLTRGWLPYTIAWEFEVVESNYPYGFSIVASGDFDGRGEWTLEQNGPFVTATYDWRLNAEKPLLRNLSFAFKPLFEAYQAQGTAELWNIHVSDRVVSPSTRRGVGRGHGKM